MSPYTLPAFVALAVNVSLIVILLLDNYRSHPHRLFVLLLACFALWNVGDILVVNSSTVQEVAVGSGIVASALIFSSTFFLNISFLFPRQIQTKVNQRLIQIVSLPIALAFSIFSALGIFQPLALRCYTDRRFYYYVLTDADTVSSAFLLLAVTTCLAIGIWNLLSQLRAARFCRERRQIRFFLYGTILYALLIAFLDVFHDHELIHFYASRSLFLVIALSFSYVVLASRLLLVHRILKHGIVYSVVAGFMFGFYVIVVHGIAAAAEKYLGIDSVWFEVAVTLLIAFLFWPLANGVQTLLDRLFYQHLFRYRDKFILFTQETFHRIDIGDLAGSVDSFLKDALQASRSQMMVRDERQDVFRSIRDPQMTTPSKGSVPSLVEKERRPFEIDELLEYCSEDERALLRAFNGGLLLGLFTKKGINGFLIVGPPIHHKVFSLDETQFLTIFTNEVSMAIERNMMMQRVKAEEAKMFQMEKLAAMGRLTAGIAHEFRNPLSIIKTSAQSILRNTTDPIVVQKAGTFIVSESERLDSIVGTFLQFAKPHAPVWERCLLTSLLEQVISSLQGKATTAGVQIRSEVAPGVPEIVTSSRHIEQALTNLGMNAIEATPTGGTLTFSAKQTENNRILLVVQDTGHGIPPEVRKRIFDPFFTTKPSGTGLGLSIAYMLIQNVKGHISFASSDAGTAFLIELPINGAE